MNLQTAVDATASQTLTLDEALAEALRLLRDEQLPQAEALYAAILAHHPQQPDALQFLGVLRHLQGRRDESIALIRQAINIAPEAPGIWNNVCGQLTPPLQEALI